MLIGTEWLPSCGPFTGEDRRDNVGSGKSLLPVAGPAAALFGLGQRGSAAPAPGAWRPRSWPQLGPDRPIAAAALSRPGSRPAWPRRLRLDQGWQLFVDRICLRPV